MSRTYDQHPARTRILYGAQRVTSVYSASQRNPPPSFRQMWREQMRAKLNRTLRNCKDFEELQIEPKIQKLSSVYDWY